MIVAIAVTDTLAEKGSGDGVRNPGVALKGAAGYVQKLKEGGNYVIIHDTMANDRKGYMILMHWLREHGIDAYDTIWEAPGKPVADLYIDGRADVPDLSRAG